MVIRLLVLMVIAFFFLLLAGNQVRIRTGLVISEIIGQVRLGICLVRFTLATLDFWNSATLIHTILQEAASVVTVIVFALLQKNNIHLHALTPYMSRSERVFLCQIDGKL